MAFTVPVPQAGSNLSELVDRARRSRQAVVLTEHGEPAAVLLSVEELGELRRLQDERDLALCRSISRRNEQGTPHDAFMESLDQAS